MVSVGDLPLNFNWTFENQPLLQFKGYSIGELGPRTSILLIETVTQEHSGSYACIVVNPSGKAKHEAILRVHG